MKIAKETKSTLMAFYQGGTKFKAALAMTIEEVEKEITNAKANGRPAKLSAIDEDPMVADEYLYFTQTNLLFYNLSSPVEVGGSGIVIAPAHIIK